MLAYGEIKNSIVWKTSDHRGKRNDLWVVVKHIRGAFGLVTFKVILRSLSALAIFCNLGLILKNAVVLLF